HGHRPHPPAAAPSRPPPDHVPGSAAVPEQRLHLPLQGHVPRVGHRGPRADLRRPVDQDQLLPRDRGVGCRDAHVPRHRLRPALPASARGAAVRGRSMTLAIQSLPFLWQGLLVTLHVSALVVLLSLVTGIMLGVALVYGPRWLYWPIRAYSDFLRGVPLLVLIFFIYYGLPVLGLNLSNFWAAVFALSAFKTAHVIEIVRGAVQSIPRGQTDAGRAIGLTFAQRLLWVIAPQAVRRFLPP